MKKLICFLCIAFVVFGLGCVSNSKTTTTNKASEVTMTVTKAPDNKSVVRYNVSSPYSPDKDDWMKTYAQEHRTSNNEELHLFTFSDGKQFEYYMTNSEASDKGSIFPASWTEEPNESLKPTKITEQQFQQNMQNILRNSSKITSSFHFGIVL
jgi:hypothetical protein